MTDDELGPTGFSGGLFVGRLFGVPVASLLIGWFASSLIEEVLGGHFINLAGYFCFGATGFLMGYRAERATTDFRKSGGLWVWILPVAVLIWAFLEEVRLFPDASSEFFLPPAHQETVLLLFVLPTFASCLYSVGILVASRRPAIH